eukprot:362504-Chlamydomonas_euryale.AAC.7
MMGMSVQRCMLQPVAPPCRKGRPTPRLARSGTDRFVKLFASHDAALTGTAACKHGPNPMEEEGARAAGSPGSTTYY